MAKEIKKQITLDLSIRDLKTDSSGKAIKDKDGKGVKVIDEVSLALTTIEEYMKLPQIKNVIDQFGNLPTKTIEEIKTKAPVFGRLINICGQLKHGNLL